MGAPRLRRRTVALLAALALVAIAPTPALATACTPSGGPPSPAAPLPGSCFEAYDGDQVDSDGSGAGNDRLDWQSVTATRYNDTGSGNRDSKFGSGGSEGTPDSWTFALGSLGSSKYDLVAAWSSLETTSPDVILELAFVRAAKSGTTNLAFELNQAAPGYRTAIESKSGASILVPTRSSGDLLITYSVDPPSIGLCTWSGNEHTGAWLDLHGNVVKDTDCPALPADLAQGAMNAFQMTAANDYLLGTVLAEKTFGEAAIDLTRAMAVVTGGNDCFAFQYLWLHSRSSVSLSSNLQDLILPTTGIGIDTCS